MVRGKPVIEEEIVSRELDGLRQRDAKVHEEEQRAIAELLERDEAQQLEITRLRATLKATQEDLDKARTSEAQLKKALNLAADRLHAAQEVAVEAKREHDVMQTKLYESQTDVNELKLLVQGSHGVRFTKKPVLGTITSAGYMDRNDGEGGAAVAELVANAAGGGPDARKAEARHAKEQMKRLLHFVKAQLANDLQRWRDDGARASDLTDEIGRRRALAA
eukprot:90477-Prymnesium_polylepis.1